VTFSESAAGSLKFAFDRLNCSEEVVPLADDYSMGPIDRGDADQRAEWEREELDYEDTIADSESVASFWKSVSTWPGRLVVWMSSRSGVELCGLHALLWRLPDANVHLIDVANIQFRPGGPAYDEGQAFANVRDDRIVEHGLLELATPISDVRRASLRKHWQRLRQENAPLRVLADKGLVSAPIDYFDDRIRARITDSWQSCLRILVEVLRTTESGPFREFQSDTFLYVRLLRLLDTDEFEGETDEELWSAHTSRIRRRPH
jgi:hypothetical protein